MKHTLCKVCGIRVPAGEEFCSDACRAIDAMPDDDIDEAARLGVRKPKKRRERRENVRKYERKPVVSEARRRIDRAYNKHRRYYEDFGELP